MTTGRCLLGRKSNIGKRVARSTIEAEAIDLGGPLERALFLREIWKEWSDEEVGIVQRTDSKALKREIASTTGLSNRKLRIDKERINKTWRSVKSGID